jgi:opacity protein-like surface antigen
MSVTLASLVAVAVVAQGNAPRFGIATGLAMPVGSYHSSGGEGFNTAWQIMALVAFKPPVIPFGVRVDVTYGAHDANDQLNGDLTSRIGQPATEKAKLVGGNVDVVYPAASAARVQPYVLGGIGVYHTTITVTVADSTPTDADTKLAWNLGGGISYSVRSIALFLEVRYISAGAVTGFPRSTVLPITAGVRFGGGGR